MSNEWHFGRELTDEEYELLQEWEQFEDSELELELDIEDFDEDFI